MHISGLVSPEQKAAAKGADILGWLPGLRRVARTAGGEWHGPCPRCGGHDRLVAWPAHPRGPRAFCRQCHPATMDAIALVQWLGRAPSFAAAVALLAGPGGAPGDLRRGLVGVVGAAVAAAARAAAVGSALGGASRPADRPAALPYRPPRAGQRVIARYNYYRPNILYIPAAEWAADPEGCAAREAAAYARPILLYQKERWEPGDRGAAKTFCLRHPRPSVGAPGDDCPADWLSGAGTDERWPYGWPAALAAPASTPLFWVDGEKDVDTAAGHGLVALCGPDGGGSWRAEWSPLFLDHAAYLIADGTPEGLAQAEHAARLLTPFPARIVIRRLPANDLSALLAAVPTPEGGPRHGS